MSRIAVIDKEKCNPQGCGGYLCIRMCPLNRMGKEAITIDPADKKALIHEEIANEACQVCVNICPFGAIHLVNLPDELAKQPIHKYPPNQFHLYNLPTPVFGKVVGIIGRNGIGKSTAIKILAGQLMPNLGQPEKQKTSHDELIEFFKGTEAQVFFEKLKQGNITVSFKPQQIDLIQKKATGKVRDLLEKVDDENKLDKIAEALDLKGLLDRDIAKISGGEMQRVAIAATVLKKANFYIFDEPTSYLDIKQRIRVGHFIKDLANENTSVIVVDHDLLIMDLMCDLMHVMFGKERIYGIVSLPYAIRNGINSYLEGYLKEQNIRFRSTSLKFFSKPPTELAQKAAITSWKDLHKKLDVFELNAEEGEVPKGAVVGILGENGIGKTSFVKLLAHVMEPDEGKVDEKITVSYKPQYLESDSEELVSTVLKIAVEKFKAQLIEPLEITDLLPKQLNQLSGGELQRVSIAHCLSQRADLYLLDEPSAYLDVEQRTNVAKIIKDLAEVKGISVMVVDHDLLFMDYLSDQLIVFEGIPAIKGEAKGPFTIEDGMNVFLRDLAISMRRDKDSRRPRINKPDSRLDREQKEAGKLYYA